MKESMFSKWTDQMNYIKGSRKRKVVAAVITAAVVFLIFIGVGLIAHDCERSSRNESFLAQLKARKSGGNSQQSTSEPSTVEVSEPTVQLERFERELPDYGTIPSNGLFWFASEDGKATAYVYITTTTLPQLGGGTFDSHTICIFFYGFCQNGYLGSVDNMYDDDDHWTIWDKSKNNMFTIAKDWKSMWAGTTMEMTYLPVHVTERQHNEIIKALTTPAAPVVSPVNPSTSNSSDQRNEYLHRENGPNYVPCSGGCNNGRCPRCGGTGVQVDNVYDPELGRMSNVVNDCPFCVAGDCGVCHGTGQIIVY